LFSFEQLTAQVIHGDPTNRLKGSQVVRKATTARMAYTNNDLPDGTLQHFTSEFVPLWRNYAGTMENPWGVLKEMQVIWDIVFPDTPQTVTRGDAIYHLVRILCTIF
jgi:hypothetical protein